MRKYNNKTKKTMIIILILFVVIVVIFSYAIKKSIDIDRTAYEIKSGVIMFDKEQNMITTSNVGILRIKWGGDYYLKYNDKDYDIGSHAVVYNTNNGNITLYGKYYEVTKTGEVEVTKGETLIKSSVNSKFYKLADRKYLIIDRTIESEDSSFVTSNYLIINLDKLGNATLLNDKTSYKTITPTVLRTSSYKFDIANEKLNFGGEDIDLKKIIGSTNEYDEDTYNLNATNKDGETETDGAGTGNGSGSGSGGAGDGSGTGGSGSGGSGTGSAGGTGTGGTGSGTGTGGSGGSGGSGGGSTGIGGNNTGINNDGTTAGGSSTINNNYNSGISDETVQEIINATKNTSVIRITPNLNSISVDYVVYDPLNEYKSVYVEIENSTNNHINVVYLSKTDTNLKISDLMPNVYYNLTFKYSYYDENKMLKEYTFDEVGLHTKMPKIILTTTKITTEIITDESTGEKTNKKFLHYKVSLDKEYTISRGTIKLHSEDKNNQFIDISESIPPQKRGSSFTGKIDITDLNLVHDKDIEITLVSLVFDEYTINPSVNYKFRY